LKYQEISSSQIVGTLLHPPANVDTRFGYLFQKLILITHFSWENTAIPSAMDGN
jgi:hypothetical protein